MKKLAILLLVSLVMSSWTIRKNTKAALYPGFYEEKPLALLVMPPINNTIYDMADEMLYVTVTEPLCEAGYYVFPQIMTYEFLASESVYDSNPFLESDLKVFKDVLGADAVVFPILEEWNDHFDRIKVGLRYVIRSTSTGKTLFERNCRFVFEEEDDDEEEEDDDDDDFSIEDLDMMATFRKCNKMLFRDLPFGKYHPQHLADSAYATSVRDRNYIVEFK